MKFKVGKPKIVKGLEVGDQTDQCMANMHAMNVDGNTKVMHKFASK